METFITCLLPLILLPLSLYLVSLARRKGSDDEKKLPPGSYGWPILGEHAVYAISGAQKLVRDRMQRYSPVVFKTSLFGQKIAVLCGAEGNKLIYKNEYKLFKTWLPPSLQKVVHPESAHVDGSNESKIMFRNFQYEVLKPEALKRYVAVTDAMAREHLENGWRPNSVVKVFPTTLKYTFELAWRLFLNVDAARVGGLLEPFAVMTRGVVSMDLGLPGTAVSRAVEAGKTVRGEMMRIIEERRSVEVEGGDLLSKMVTARDEDGKHLSDAKIANFMMGLLVGAQYEITSAITLVMNFLAQLPHIYDEVLTEQMKIAESKGPDDPVTWVDIEKMKYTWNVVRESFRLAPPSIGSFREAVDEFTYAGFIIPKGWKVMWSAHSCHENPDYFPEPEKFDPSRFEGNGPAPYTYVPFGGGPRMCPGRGYAKLVVMVFIHNVVTRFRFQKVIPNEKLMFHVTPKPTHALPLRLQPHKK